MSKSKIYTTVVHKGQVLKAQPRDGFWPSSAPWSLVSTQAERAICLLTATEPSGACLSSMP